MVQYGIGRSRGTRQGMYLTRHRQVVKVRRYPWMPEKRGTMEETKEQRQARHWKESEARCAPVLERIYKEELEMAKRGRLVQPKAGR